jgi:hypothetical protein
MMIGDMMFPIKLLEVDYSEEIQNDLSITKLLRATNVINVAGVPTCVSVIDGTDPDCIPYNYFLVVYRVMAESKQFMMLILRSKHTWQSLTLFLEILAKQFSKHMLKVKQTSQFQELQARLAW